MKQNPHNRMTDEELLGYLQREAPSDIDTSWINVEQEWQAFQNTVQHAPEIAPKGVLRHIGLWRMAAVWILLAGIALVLIVYRPFSRGIEVVAAAQVVTQNLPDGSVVTLNKKSTLSYERSYNKENRMVTLSGEAFFSVAPNTKLPFLVRAGDVTVEVLGTSFNLKSMEEKTTLIVESGRVKIKTAKAVLVLNAGERVTLEHDSVRMLKEPVADSLYAYYRTHNFSCKNTSLKELLAALTSAYDVKIIVDNVEDEQMLITANFSDVSLDNIVKVLCAVLNRVSVKQGDTIVLKRL